MGLKEQETLRAVRVSSTAFLVFFPGQLWVVGVLLMVGFCAGFMPLDAGEPGIEIEAATDSASFPLAQHIPGAVAFNGHWYLRIDERVSGIQARIRCQKMGGHLVCIETPQENEFVASLTEGKAVLTGGFHFQEGWKWINGSEMKYFNWGSDNPNGKIGEFLFMQFRPNEPGKWFDNPNLERLTNPLGYGGFICEWDK